MLADKPADTGRSFVVLRDRKPSQPLASGSGSGSGEAPDAPPAKSFVVLRGKDNTLT